MESEKLQKRIKELELEVSQLKASKIISQKAQLNDQSFYNLIEQSLCPILILKGDNLILDVANDPSFKILNVGKEAVGKPFLEILPEMKDQPFMGLLLDVLHNHTTHYGKEQPAHFTRENGDIETGYFNFVYQPYAEIDGTVTGVLVFATNVTDQVIAYKKLEESQYSFSEMINSSPNLIAVLKSEDLIIEIANDAIMEVWGKGSDVKGKKYFYVLPELVSQGIPEMINEVYTTGKPFSVNELPVYLLRNGISELNYYSFVFQPQRSAVGIIEGIAIIGLDVTFQAKQNLKIKESEEQLRKTTEHFEIATSAAEVGTWSLSLATQTLEWSGLHKKMWGYDEKRTDLVYEDWHKVILETDKEIAFEAVAKALATKTQYETSYRIKLDGREDVRWMRSSGKYFYNDAGKAIALTGVSIDITEQKKLEHLLEYRKALLEANNEASIDGVLLVDAKGKILSYNKRFIEIWNMPQHIVDANDDKAALNFAMEQLVNPQQFIEKVNYLYQHPTETCMDILEYKNGKIVERYGYPVVAADGNQCVWNWTFRDITEIKKAQLALQRSEQHFRLMADLMPAKISNATPVGTVTYFNKHWLDYTGMNFDDLNEFGYLSIIHPDELKEFQNRFLKAAATGNVLEMEMRFKNKNGDYKWHLNLASPIKDENGTITMWVGSTTEIQHQKEQREELEKAVAEGTYELKQANVLLEDKNRSLQNMNKELEAFNYISSHDLQEPLRKIQIIISRILDLENQNLSESSKNHFIVLQKAADRMRTLIQDLLAFSRLNTTDILFEKTDLNAIIEEVKKEFEDVITEKNATIEIIDNCKIHVVRFQFRQLMNNLIENALKFYNPKIAPQITIKTKILQPDSLSLPLILVGKEYCHISISDNGIGFEKEFETKIFEVFQRLHSQEQYSGTGIGLAIVKKIVDNHNGMITATSKLNEGATFDVYIPTNHKT